LRKRYGRIKRKEESKLCDHSLNIVRKMDPEKKAFLDKFDEILEKHRSDDQRDLYKQISNLDVKHLFNCFTI